MDSFLIRFGVLRACLRCFETHVFFNPRFWFGGLFCSVLFWGPGHNFGIALGSPGASGGLIKAFARGRKGRFTREKRAIVGPRRESFYELALE